MEQFNITVALFLFKRGVKSAVIIDQIAKIKPKKIYLIGDGARNKDEELAVHSCRAMVEEHITWNCEIQRNYSNENRGVYDNIANGAKWVFEREPYAIFLEDDNFPALSFFRYCEELLYKYENDARVLWICGTNYMQKYEPEDGSDYVFTKLMLPCGWASWRSKFCRFYDGEMSLFRDSTIRSKVRKEYTNSLLYKQDLTAWEQVIYEVDNNKRIFSWDYQMAFCIRANNLFGIAPKYNLIKNIGADMESIHGGNTMDKEMTSRFCEVPIIELEFPLKHPKALMIDEGFERKTESIIIAPFKDRLKNTLINIIKAMLHIKKQESLSQKIHEMLKI